MIDCPVSHEWICQYIARDKAADGEIFQSLRQYYKRFPRRSGVMRSPIKDAVSIVQRPAIFYTYLLLGDWEAGTITF